MDHTDSGSGLPAFSPPGETSAEPQNGGSNLKDQVKNMALLTLLNNKRPATAVTSTFVPDPAEDFSQRPPPPSYE